MMSSCLYKAKWWTRNSALRVAGHHPRNHLHSRALHINTLRCRGHIVFGLRNDSLLAHPDDDKICFCLDSAIADLSHLTISLAYTAARELWPGRVVGPVALYVEKARPILPVLAEPHHAVVLVRLLCDEGVIGARSTAGREGPVVGRAVRRTGSRPLLVAEIAEHWPVVMDSCLLRWSFETGAGARGPGEGEGRAQAQDNGGGQQPRGGGSNGRDELLARARVAFRSAQEALMADDNAVQACLDRVSPHSTAVEAVKGSAKGPLTFASTLPAELGLRVLQRCGLVADSSEAAGELDCVFASSWAAVVSTVVSRAAAGGARVQLVTGNLARLERLAELGDLENWNPEAEGMDWEAAVLSWAGGDDNKQGGRGAGGDVSGGLDRVTQGDGRMGAAPGAADAAQGGSQAFGWQAAAAGSAGGVAVPAAGPRTDGAHQLGSYPSGGATAVGRGADGGNHYGGTTACRSSSSGSSSNQPSRQAGGAEFAPERPAQVPGMMADLPQPGLAYASDGRGPPAGGGSSGGGPAGSVPCENPRGDSQPADLVASRSEDRDSSNGGGPADWGPQTSWSGATCRNGKPGAAEGSGSWAALNDEDRGSMGRCLTASTAAAAEDMALPPAASATAARPAEGSAPEPFGDPYRGSGVLRSSLAPPWPTLRTVHLAEWSCSNVSYRARALSYQPRASLLSEHQLAEWLGVTHLDIVMDGVAWR